MSAAREIIAWKVIFEDGSVELYLVESIQGKPTFGGWITPMIAGGETIDLDLGADND